eukprot:Skav221687  [mRNA]  locus=scaffold1494:265716:275211:+ [translate_table: standard]
MQPTNYTPTNSPTNQPTLTTLPETFDPSLHQTSDSRQAFLRAAEFGDLPAVRSMALEANAELSGLRCTVRALPPKLGHSASSPWDEPKKKRPETPALAKTKGITGRLARSENNLTRMASTLAKRDELIWERARTGEQALPALAKALKSERIAVKAAQMNPKLLRVSEPQIRKIMPTLVSICGGAQQAAYAVVWRPELLELEAASSLREALQAASCFFGNLKDAARTLHRGGFLDMSPKTLAKGKHGGSQKGVVGSDTMQPCWTFTSNYSPSLKKYDYCDPEVLGWAETSVKSPDQVEAGDWHFPAEAG